LPLPAALHAAAADGETRGAGTRTEAGDTAGRETWLAVAAAAAAGDGETLSIVIWMVCRVSSGWCVVDWVEQMSLERDR